MNSKSLGITLVIAVIAIVLGTWLNTERFGDESREFTVVVPGLQQVAHDADYVKLTTGGNTVLIEAKKENGDWQMVNLDGYPANAEPLSELVTAIKGAKRLEKKTSNPDRFDKLGLRDVSVADSEATQIEIGVQGKRFAVILGKATNNRKHSYARLADSNETWLIDRVVTLPKKPQDWLQRFFVEFKKEDIKAISFEGDRKHTLKRASAEDDFTLDMIPEGRKLEYPSVTNVQAQNYAELAMTDVIRKAKISATPQVEHKIFVDFFNGEKLTIELSRLDDKYYVNMVPVTVHDQESVLAGKIPLWDTWYYEISSYRYDHLVKKVEEYLAPLKGQKKR